MKRLELHPRRNIKFLGGPMHGVAVPVDTICPDHLLPEMSEYFLSTGERYELWLVHTMWGPWFTFVRDGYLPTDVDMLPNERYFCAN